MTDKAARIFQQALELSIEERADLAVQLMASVDNVGGEAAEAAWVAELETRARNALDGTTRGEDWSVVRAEIERIISAG